MVELVDTQDLGSCEMHFVRVQVPLQAPIVMIFNIHNEYSYGMLLLSLIRLIRGIRPHHNNMMADVFSMFSRSRKIPVLPLATGAGCYSALLRFKDAHKS